MIMMKISSLASTISLRSGRREMRTRPIYYMQIWGVEQKITAINSHQCLRQDIGGRPQQITLVRWIESLFPHGASSLDPLLCCSTFVLPRCFIIPILANKLLWTIRAAHTFFIFSRNSHLYTYSINSSCMLHMCLVKITIYLTHLSRNLIHVKWRRYYKEQGCITKDSVLNNCL